MNDVSEKEKEFSDIELCYKAMGLSFSDNPEQVEKTYRKLKESYGKAMSSSDSTERVKASDNLNQLEELFSTITGSLIYKDYAREYEKYKAIKAEKLAERKLKQQQQPIVKEKLIDCPYCHKPISEKLKVCIYCRGKILTPMEQLIVNIFSVKNVIVLTAITLLALVGVVFYLNPHLLRG